MKKTVKMFLLILPLFAGMFMATSPLITSENPEEGRSGCGGSVEKGCVGEAGAEYSFRHVVMRSDVVASKMRGSARFCLNTTSNNLCNGYGASFQLSKNGKVVTSGELSAGAIGRITAKVGDIVTGMVKLNTPENQQDCIQLGNLCFNLGYQGYIEK